MMKYLTIGSIIIFLLLLVLLATAPVPTGNVGSTSNTYNLFVYPLILLSLIGIVISYKLEKETWIFNPQQSHSEVTEEQEGKEPSKYFNDILFYGAFVVFLVVIAVLQ